MRITCIILATIATILGVVFTILPMGSMGAAPGIAGVIFAYLAFRISKGNSNKFLKTLLLLAMFTTIAAVAKHYFATYEVAKDTEFIQKEQESKQKALQELEDLEKELDSELEQELEGLE